MLSIIKEACVKANSSIMELKWGCYVHTRTWGRVRIVSNEDDYVYYLLPDGTAGDEDSLEFFQTQMIEIEGRDVCLSDVLLTMFHNKKTGNNGYERSATICDIWNLFQDNLNCQSEETLLFLANLLK